MKDSLLGPGFTGRRVELGAGGGGTAVVSVGAEARLPVESTWELCWGRKAICKILPTPRQVNIS